MPSSGLQPRGEGSGWGGLGGGQGALARQPEPWFRLQGLFHLHGSGGIHRALECPAKVLPVSADRPEKQPEFLRARSQDLGTEDPWGPGRSRGSSLRAPRGHGALAPFKGSTAWPCRGGWRLHSAPGDRDRIRQAWEGREWAEAVASLRRGPRWPRHRHRGSEAPGDSQATCARGPRRATSGFPFLHAWCDSVSTA